MKLIRGIFHRAVTIQDNLINQLVLPRQLIQSALTGIHNNNGHPGKDRTIGFLRDRFFWTGMNFDTENWIKNCNRCLRRKSTCQKAPLINITSSYVLQLVCLDYLTLEPCKGGINNILVITDHYTRFTMAIPTKNQTAKTTVESLFNNFIIHYGLPASYVKWND